MPLIAVRFGTTYRTGEETQSSALMKVSECRCHRHADDSRPTRRDASVQKVIVIDADKQMVA